MSISNISVPMALSSGEYIDLATVIEIRAVAERLIQHQFVAHRGHHVLLSPVKLCKERLREKLHPWQEFPQIELSLN